MQDECERSVWSCCRVNVFSRRRANCGRGVSRTLSAKFASFAVRVAAIGTRCRSMVTLWRFTVTWCSSGGCATATARATAGFRWPPGPTQCCDAALEGGIISGDSRSLLMISIKFDECTGWGRTGVSADLAEAIAIARAGFTNEGVGDPACRAPPCPSRRHRQYGCRVSRTYTGISNIALISCASSSRRHIADDRSESRQSHPDAARAQNVLHAGGLRACCPPPVQSSGLTWSLTARRGNHTILGCLGRGRRQSIA
jgi:hypothetical protein